MKRATIAACFLISLLPGAISAQMDHAGNWVKDTRVSSQDILSPGQAFRIVAMGETQALEMIRQVMSRDLHLSLDKYEQPKRLQAAQTTTRTLLPEKITGQNAPALADKDYCFSLEAKLKTVGNKTRIMLVANPVYRAEPKKAGAAENSIEIKVKSDSTQAVGMGPILVMPTAGQPADFNLQTLPDAGERAAKLVRSFMYYLDLKVAVIK